MKQILTLLIACFTISALSAQKVGIMTDAPQSVLHVFSSGQVLHPDGLFMMGNKSEAHMRADFNYFQSLFSDQGTVLNMYLQPQGGNLGVKVPLNSSPYAALHVYGDGVNLAPYGLTMIGNRFASHLDLDFDRIQAMSGTSPQTLHLQAGGGDINMASGTLFVDESAGTVGVGDVNPDASLDIISGGSTDATMALQVRSASYNNLLMVRDNGNVGIGTSAPHYDLEVIGNIGVTSNLIHANDDDTFLSFTPDRVSVDVGGKTFLDMVESPNGQDNIFIGAYDVDINLNNLLYVDHYYSKVGIGTTAPSYLLDVNGTMGVSDYIIHNDDANTYISFTDDRVRMYAGGIQMLDMNETTNDYIDIGAGAIYIDIATEDVGIGTLSPETDLHISHGWQGGLTIQNGVEDWRIGTNDNGSLGFYNQGAWKGHFEDEDGDYVSQSDLRLKKNIENIPPVLEKVRQLAPKLYHFKTQEDSVMKNIGFIAQEVTPIFPEIVSYNEDEDLFGLDYNDFAVISIKAIQELDALVKVQQEQIAALKEVVMSMKAEVAKR